MEENWNLGSDIKVKVELEAQGFDMDLHDWDVAVYVNGKKTHTYPKADCARDGEGNWFVPISASHLKKPGAITLAATAYVPDEDFSSGTRREVAKEKIGNNKAI